jgi:hypothetical protein
MTPMQQTGNAVLNALDEGKVTAVIALYDAGIIPRVHPDNRRGALRSILVNVLDMDPGEVDHWLNEFKVISPTMGA